MLIKYVQIKMIFRGWARNKVYTFISLLSLVSGLTCSVLLIAFVMREYRIADSVPDSECTYIIESENSQYNHVKMFSVESELPVRLQETFPDIRDICVFKGEDAAIVQDKGLLYTEKYFSVLPEFLDFFKPEVVSGDLERVLSGTTELAVSESYGRKLFGEENPLGKVLTMEIRKYMPVEKGYGYWVDARQEYTVAAVFKDMKNSILCCNMLRGLSREILTREETRGLEFYAFVKLNPKADRFVLEKKIDQNAGLMELADGKVRLLPADQIYFNPTEYCSLLRGRDKSLLYISLSIALAILLIACFNYVNISMTRNMQRLRNTGQQMVCGALVGSMRLQLITETFIQVVLSFGIAVWLIYEILPVFNAFLGADLSLSAVFYGPARIVFLLLIVVLSVGPSFYIFSRLGKIQLSAVLKNETQRKSELIKGMVVAQFVVSAVLVAVVLNIHRQMEYIAHSRPDSDRIVAVNPTSGNFDEKTWDAFRNQLRTLPEIEAVTTTKMTQNMSGQTGDINYCVFDCDDSYFDVYGVKILMGNGFSSLSAKSDQVLVNETFASLVGKSAILGYTFDYWDKSRKTVVGVVNDFQVDRFSMRIPPMVLHPDPSGAGRLVVKAGENTSYADLKMKINTLWYETAPGNTGLSCLTMADIYKGFHRDELRLMKTVWIFMWVSLLLTGVGLFGLAWYTVESRKKEIGVRKINGASGNQVMLLICGQFMIWIGVAFLIALPLAFYFTEEWMKQFLYKADFTLWTYLLAGGFIFSVGFLTVIWQSRTAAGLNPVEMFKNEI